MPWKHVVAPTKGLVTNKPSTGIEEQASPYMSGVVLRDGEIRSDFGMSAFPTAGALKTNDLNGTLMRIDQLFLLNGDSHLLALTTSHIYEYNTTTDTWDVITQGNEVDDCEAVWDAQSGLGTIRSTAVKLRDTYATALFKMPAPVFHFKCNDDASDKVVTDDGSGGNNGTSSHDTDTFSATAKIGDGFDFESGTENWIDIDSSLAGIASDTAGTISFWFKPEAISSDLIIAFGDTDANTYLSIYYFGTSVYASMYIANSEQWTVICEGDVANGTWAHVVLTHNGTEPKMYVDTVESHAHLGGSSPVSASWFSAASGLDNGRIGCKSANSAGNVGFLDGILDDVRYYSSALNTTQIKALYNGGSGTESGGGGFTTGLMASEDDVQTADISGATNTHLCFWARSDTAAAAGAYRLRLSEQATGAAGATYADYNLPALVADTWQHVSVAIASPDASDGGTYPDDLNAVASVAILAVADPASAILYIDDVRTAKAFTGDADNRWSTATLNDTMVITNGVDAPTKVTSGATHAALTLSLPSGAITTCEIVIPFKDHMLYFNNTENAADAPQRCSWSNIGAVDDLVAGTAGFQDLLDDESWIVGVAQLSENEVAIYKERSVIQCTWIGGHTPFRFKTIVTGTGAINKDCITETGGGHTVLGPDVTYIYKGQREIEIIDDNVKRTMYDRLDGAYIDRAFLMFVEEDDELQIWLPVGSTIPDEGYTLNVVNDSWYLKDRSISGFGYYKEQSSRTIGDLVGTIGEQDWTFGSQLIKQYFPITLVGDANGKIYKLDKTTLDNDGTAIVNEFQTPDFALPGIPEYMNHHMRVAMLNFEAKGQSVTVHYSTDGGSTWGPTQGGGTNVVSLDSIYKAYEQYFETDAKLIRFRFRNTSAASGFQIRYYGFYWILKSRRK